MRLVLLALALALLPGCSFYQIEHSYFADGHSETSVTEYWCCTGRPKASFESKREYYPKQVAMNTEMVGMQVSLNTDTGRAPCLIRR